jgi:hypothetical protein
MTNPDTIKPNLCADGHIPETVSCEECMGRGCDSGRPNCHIPRFDRTYGGCVVETFCGECAVCHGTGSITRCKVCGERMEEK